MATTRLFLNDTDEPITLKEHGRLEIGPHQHVSVHTDHHQSVLLENYPGLLDVTDAQLDADEDGNLTVRANGADGEESSE